MLLANATPTDGSGVAVQGTSHLIFRPRALVRTNNSTELVRKYRTHLLTSTWVQVRIRWCWPEAATIDRRQKRKERRLGRPCIEHPKRPKRKGHSRSSGGQGRCDVAIQTQANAVFEMRRRVGPVEGGEASKGRA